MKYLILLLIFVCCGYKTPILTDNECPFVVKKITYHNDSLSAYYSEIGGGVRTFCLFEHPLTAAVILPRGMFSVGDTVRVVRAITSKIEERLNAKDAENYEKEQ